MMKNAWRAAACAALLGAATAAVAQPEKILDLATYPRAALEIVQRTPQAPRRFHFDVWVADTAERSEQGLMFVRDLPADQGMVFPLQPVRVATFWMKNTYIELDMLFIASDGRIAKIIRRAPPLKLDILSSDVPVGAVLELRGGEAEHLGLKVGDQVSWKPAGKSAP